MVHTVHLDDRYTKVKRLLQSIRRQEQGVRFESSLNTNHVAQEEYMTSEDFWKEADKRIIKLCERNGIL